MSQRRKGPGRPPTSSTIPSLSRAPPPRARVVLLPLPLKTRDLPSLRGAPSEPVLESICLSHLPASNPGEWTGPGLRPWLVASSHLCCPLPTPSHPIPSSVCADVACSMCF